MANGPGANGVAATVRPGQRTVVSVAFGIPGFCMLVQPIHFQTAGSWVAPLPDHLAALAVAADRLARSPASRLLVVGHTDDQGAAPVNDSLSLRRARAVLAVLTGDTAAWEEIFRVERVDGGATPWGRDTFSTMLTGTGAVAAQADIDQHRALTAAGEGRRTTLFAAYFRVLLSSPRTPVAVRSTNPAFLGCGEQHVLAPGNHPPSRRADLVFFSGTGAPTLDRASYPGWRNPCAPKPLPPTQTPATAFHLSLLGSDTGDGSQGAPWHSFAHALQEIAARRKPGERVTLMVWGGTWHEPVAVPSGTTIEGVGTPLPEIRAVMGEPAVLMEGGRDKHLRGLKLMDGSRSGVRIEGVQDASVRGCEIVNNYAPRGGGVAIVDSARVTVENCVIEHNEAGDIGSAVRHVVLEVLPTRVDRCGDVRYVVIQDLKFTPGDSHGGGVYVENSSFVAILSNQIRDNRAILFGGGIAVDNRPDFTGLLLIQSNEITCNQVAHAALGALGPAASCGTDMGDPVTGRLEDEIPLPIADALAAQRIVQLLHGSGRESGMGGGVALRHVGPGTRLALNDIGQEGRGNRARRGGGVACFTGAYPTLVSNQIAFNQASDDGGGVSIDEFDPFLPAARPAFFGFSRGKMLSRQPIRMEANVLKGNACLEDGGAMYATGGAKLEMAGGTIAGNRAGQNGGGIRISYAVRLHMTDVTVSGNQSRAFGGNPADGGGGVAARNAELHLERCTFTGNVANGFAGGAVFCTSAFEGGFDALGFLVNQHGQFDEMMEKDHGFTARHYRFTDCSGSGNRATGGSGAGGFLYAVRDPGERCGNPMGGDQPLHVTLEGSATSIGANTSEYDRPDDAKKLRRKRANVTIELSGQPDAVGRPQDRVTVLGLAPGSVALSIPSADGKAITVLHDDDGMPPDEQPAVFLWSNLRPLVQAVHPAAGGRAGGTPVVITGQDFVTGAQVSFGGLPATVESLTPAEARVVTTALPPSRPAGPVNVVVRNPDGHVGFLPGAFTYT